MLSEHPASRHPPQPVLNRELQPGREAQRGSDVSSFRGYTKGEVCARRGRDPTGGCQVTGTMQQEGEKKGNIRVLSVGLHSELGLFGKGKVR